jgi:CheY-like chemotaxis protein
MSQSTTAARQWDILLVEDNEDDVLLTQHAFKRAELPGTIHVAHDGVEGLRFLRREAPCEDAPRPDLILLDLNMPRMDGRQMLSEMKSDPNLMHIPVIVLTTSNAECDIAYAYEAHANAYMTKPVDFKTFANEIQRFIEFWFGLAKLPLVSQKR